MWEIGYNSELTYLNYDDSESSYEKYIIPHNDFSSSLLSKTNYTTNNNLLSTPNIYTYEHPYSMDEMNGTTTYYSNTGISGERLEWQIGAISQKTKFVLDANSTDVENNLYRIKFSNRYNADYSTMYPGEERDYTSNSKVKLGYIPRKPMDSDSWVESGSPPPLYPVDIINNSSGSNFTVTSGMIYSNTNTDESSLDISFNSWREGRTLFFPHKEKDSSAPSEEDSYWFNNTFKFKTDISGATNAFDAGETITYYVKVLTYEMGLKFAIYRTSDYNNLITQAAGNMLVLKGGNTYIFDQSDSTNSNHPIAFTKNNTGSLTSYNTTSTNM